MSMKYSALRPTACRIGTIVIEGSARVSALLLQKGRDIHAGAIQEECRRSVGLRSPSIGSARPLTTLWILLSCLAKQVLWINT